jgi:hypothetical protein
MRKLHFLTLGLALMLVGAAPVQELTVEELLRQGNEAFARGDYAAAVAAFGQAEDLTDDPGQAAFNKAAALYRMAVQSGRDGERVKLLAEAGQNYRWCLEDAEGSRRWAALFGLGNSLLQQHPAGGTRVLFDAVACYEQVLAAADAEPSLKNDARHNLELARLLWAKQRKESDPNQNKPQDNDPQTPPKPQDPPRTQSDQGADHATGTPQDGGDKVRVDLKPGEKPVPVEEAAAGARPLPPVPETDAESLSVDDAKEHLKRALKKIRDEKLEFQQRGAQPPARGVKDW